MLVTKDELMRLKNMPPKPPALIATPNGTMRHQADQEFEMQKQNKIRYIEQELSSQSQNFRENMAANANRGLQKAQFNLVGGQKHTPVNAAQDHSAGQVKSDQSPKLEQKSVQDFRASMRERSTSMHYEMSR